MEEITSLIENKQQLEAYFEAFGDIQNQKYNTRILYEENNIDFITLNGEKYNIKLKNNIQKIFSLSDGILIKIDNPSEEFNFFKNSSQINSDTQESGKYMYYIINTHPLNSISIVKCIRLLRSKQQHVLFTY